MNIKMATRLEAGVLLVDKPVGATSFSMVRNIRKITGIKKVGHAGTLDPFATGLLVVCVSRSATKMISLFMDGEKEYQATLRLGARSSTQDPEGEITPAVWEGHYSDGMVTSVLDLFKGEIQQVPPAFSAVKHKGKPLYYYARKGISIKKEARKVHIHSLEWLDSRSLVEKSNPSLTVKVTCSKGTYIRTLAAEIGEKLGCGAYLTSLRRTKSGFFSVDAAMDGLDFLKPDAAERIDKSLLSLEDIHKYLQ